MTISNAAILPRMTSDEFLAWAAGQSDDARYELHDGFVVLGSEPLDGATAMAGERRLNGLVKNNVNFALNAVLETPCRPCVDGIAIKVNESRTFIPDVLVDCGDQSDFNAMTADEPVIVVEVVSDNTSKIDTGVKLEGYFTVPAIQRYLIIDGGDRRVIHHQRDGARIATTILHGGPLTLDPPGVTVDANDFWRGVPEMEKLNETHQP